jgi:hypothetical protein
VPEFSARTRLVGQQFGRLPGCVLVARDVCRNEAIRLGRRILALDADLPANYTALAAAVTDQAPDPVAVEQRPQC